MDIIQDNIKRLKEDIAVVCTAAGRGIEGIRLVAVSKTMDVGKIQQAIDAGLDTFGENYVQEAMEKINAFPSAIHWHFIGNIQKNKVKYIVKSFELIHSVGNRDVAAEIDKRAMQRGHVQPVLFEINAGAETSKSGFLAGQFFDAVPFLKTFKHILPSGLMTMPPPIDNEIQLSSYFAKLREIRDKLLKQGIFGQSFKELSMGMSSDYKIAIKEGATMIRIGTAIFGTRG